MPEGWKETGESDNTLSNGWKTGDLPDFITSAEDEFHNTVTAATSTVTARTRTIRMLVGEEG